MTASEKTNECWADPAALERLYRRYTRRTFVHPDPLEFLYAYEDPGNREVAGLVASALAFGGVKQILTSAGTVLERLGKPRATLMDASRRDLERMFAGVTHRWADGSDVAALLWGTWHVIDRHGSLRACFEDALSPEHETVHPALCRFTGELAEPKGCGYNSLLPCPPRGSACKRLHLFLRWMVRRDRVDPGGWDGVPAAKLLMPMDVHMHRIARRLGMTDRASADLETAREVTRGFRRLVPDDPVKYDFALSRLGIRGDEDLDDVLPTLML